MLLTSRQNEGLKQFLTQGFVRISQKSLAELTPHRIEMNVTEFSLHPLNRLGSHFSSFLAQEMVMVHQSFQGSISGDVALLLDYENAFHLCYGFERDYHPTISRQSLSFSDEEVLKEVGNVLLNNYLTTLNHVLQLQIDFSPPSLRLEPLPSILNGFVVGRSEIRYSLVSGTSLLVGKDRLIRGSLILISGVLSLSVLLKAVETWEVLGNPSDFSKISV